MIGIKDFEPNMEKFHPAPANQESSETLKKTKKICFRIFDEEYKFYAIVCNFMQFFQLVVFYVENNAS